MKQKKPLLHWERFEPIAYELNWPVVSDLGITITDESGAPSRTTVGTILREAIPGRFMSVGTDAIPEIGDEFDMSFDIRMPNRVVTVDRTEEDNHFPAQVLHRVLALLQMEHGTDYHAQLFFYDSEWGHREETSWDRFHFFVVVGDNIVEDAFELSSLCEQDIDENVLKPAWHEDDSWKTPGHDTGLRWWYSKFYRETRAGQLMVMRGDAPRIFHYVPPEHRETTNAKNLARIAQAATWIAVAVGLSAALWLLRFLFGRG